GELDLEIFRPVARKQGHPIAAREPATCQHRGRAVDPIAQFAIADAPFPELDGQRRFLDLRAGTKQAADGRKGTRRRGERLREPAFHDASSIASVVTFCNWRSYRKVQIRSVQSAASSLQHSSLRHSTNELNTSLRR